MDDATFTVENKNTGKRRSKSITVLGDSTIKNIEAHRMKECIKSREKKFYIKSFSGATIADMTDYSKPTQKYNPDLIFLHSCTNDLKLPKDPEEISNEIIKLALNMKTDTNDVTVSGITIRDDEFNEKGQKVKGILKIECKKYALGFVDNSNITKKHLNGSFLLIGDFNSSVSETNLKDFCELYNLENLIKDPTCFKNASNPSLIDVMLTNRKDAFQNSRTIDHHKLITSVLKTNFKKKEPVKINYRSYKNFDESAFRNDLLHNLQNCDNLAMQYDEFKDIFMHVLSCHAPKKQKEGIHNPLWTRFYQKHLCIGQD